MLNYWMNTDRSTAMLNSKNMRRLAAGKTCFGCTCMQLQVLNSEQASELACMKDASACGCDVGLQLQALDLDPDLGQALNLVICRCVLTSG